MKSYVITEDEYNHDKMNYGKKEFIVYDNVCTPPVILYTLDDETMECFIGKELLKIFLVVEDYGFYSEDQWDHFISLEDINRSCHSKVHFAGSSREAAEQVLNEMIKCEEEDWDTKVKEMTIRNVDDMITGYYILGSFYYIQEVELE